MNTLTAPEQSSTKEWHGIRMGRFTASTFGKLMGEPKKLTASTVARYEHLVPAEQAWKTLKSGPRKGQQVRADGFDAMLREAMAAHGIVLFGDTAHKLIAAKAVEKHSGVPMYTARTKSMDRGTLLEHAARILISRYHFEVDGVTFQEYGKESGATPDGLIGGHTTWQCKCPEDAGDLLRFSREVKDRDFDTLLSWDADYAWQIMVEAIASGTDKAAITMFTDRLNATAITPDELQGVQDVMDAVANHLGDQLGYPMYYRYAGTGFAEVTRSFFVTEEIRARIDRTLAAAVVERNNYQQEIALMA